MTAPEMVSIIAAVLAEHQWYDASNDHEDPAIGCTGSGCDEWFGDEDVLDNGKFAAHQARAVLAAISEAGAVEWGVRWPYLSDMYPERTDTKESQEAAQASIDKSFADGAVVSRIAGPWTAVEG